MLTAQAAFMEALDRSLSSPVRFLVGAEEQIVGAADGRECEFSIRVSEPRFFNDVLCYGNLGIGESFMRGDFRMETGSLHDFLTLLLKSRVDQKVRATFRLAFSAGLVQIRNTFRPREKNVQSHYDLGTDLFESFLDSTLTYSCGFAQSPQDDLETLQRNKLDRICRKLRIQPGERLLDIGCGFGGLLIFAAEHYGARGTGITISPAQQQRANAEILLRGLGGRVEVQLLEYRKIEGRYEKVVSVGMLEHVPPSEYDLYFQKIGEVLLPGGAALVHAIGCTSPVNRHDPFIQKYVFPNSHQVRLLNLISSLERAGFAVLDVENIVRHYAYTALRWLEHFQQNQHKLEAKRYDGSFRRMWEYYLACGIAAARASDAAVYQVLFGNDRAADIPLVRV